VVASLRQDSATRARESARVAALVERMIVPHFDFRRITRLAVGPGWRQATPEQRDEPGRAFSELLSRRLAKAPRPPIP